MINYFLKHSFSSVVKRITEGLESGDIVLSKKHLSEKIVDINRLKSNYKEKNKIQLLNEIELFYSLTNEELYKVSEKIFIKSFVENETVLYEEDTNEFMYIILKGAVKVIRTTEDGKEIILALHRTGSFFGELSLIDGKSSPAAVIAKIDSQIAIISKNDFLSILSMQHKVNENFLKILCARFRKSLDIIQLLNFKNATQRIKMLFLMLVDEHGEKSPEGVTLKIKLTHQDVSDMTGLTRKTVVRVLDKLQKNDEIIILKNSFLHLTPKFKQHDINIKNV